MTCPQPGCGGTIQGGCSGTCGLVPASGLARCCPAAGDDLRQADGRLGQLAARLTPDEDRRIERIDMANAIRPRTLT